MAVIGLGYVGLPLALAMAEAGFNTVGIDVDERKVMAINAGESYIGVVAASAVAGLVGGGRLVAGKVKAGASKRLPADVGDLLKGETEDELAAHADRLAEHFKASVRPSGSADQGPRGTAPAATPKDEFAAFLKKQMGT